MINNLILGNPHHLISKHFKGIQGSCLDIPDPVITKKVLTGNDAFRARQPDPNGANRFLSGSSCRASYPCC